MEIIEIKSPVTGTFFSHGEWLDGISKKEPVKIGDHVRVDTVVCIIEALEVPLPVTTDSAGTIIEILKEDGQDVEYGQPLFRLRTDWGWNYDLEPEPKQTTYAL